MTFYRRHGVVRAVQWHRMGDHPHVLQGIHSVGGMLDIEHAKPYARRHVEPGDWIVTDNDGKHTVLTDIEFRHTHESV